MFLSTARNYMQIIWRRIIGAVVDKGRRRYGCRKDSHHEIRQRGSDRPALNITPRILGEIVVGDDVSDRDNTGRPEADPYYVPFGSSSISQFINFQYIVSVEQLQYTERSELGRVLRQAFDVGFSDPQFPKRYRSAD